MPATTDKNIAIVCNSIAGAGKALILAGKIANELSQKQINYTLFKENWPEYFNGFTDVWIIGGDGTLNYFINYYPDIKLPLVIFNGGTGNDFHFMLYGDRSFDDQLELARQLHWEIARVFTAEHAIYVRGRLPYCFHLIDAIGNQAATGHIEAERVDRR